MINGILKKVLDIFLFNVIVWFVIFRVFVMLFFIVYDVFCEEGFISIVVKVLNDIVDIYLLGVC